MLPRRYSSSASHSAFTDSERHLILAAETLRSGETAPKRKDGEKTEEKISVFWRVFGGTILSITALSVISAYQCLANNIQELRGDVGRLREGSGDYIKKDEFNTRTTTMWTGIREAQTVAPGLTVLTNRTTAVEGQLAAAERERKEMQTTLVRLTALRDHDAALEKQVRDAEAERREVLKELQRVRERLAKLEGQQEVKPGVKPAADQVK